MGLPNSFGLKYLRLSPKTGIYSYVRLLTMDIAPYVVGTVLLPWTTRAAKLSGKNVVKISLGAMTEAAVRDRWTSVHAQVNEVVSRATFRVQKEARASKSLIELDELSPASISIIAQQVRNDVLGQHDRELVNSNGSSSLAKVALRVMKSATASPKDLRVEADAFARNLEINSAKVMIAKRDFSSLDTSIREFEVDFDLGRLPFEQEHVNRGVVIPPAAMDIVNKAKTIGEVPSAINAILADNGVSLPEQHPDRIKLALAVTRAKINALQDIKKREEGREVETPVRPVLPLPVVFNKVPTIREMHVQWIQQRRPGQKSIDDNRLYLERFVSMHGDLAVNKISKDHIRQFRDNLLQFPRNVPAGLRSAHPDDVIAWARANPKLPLLGRFTINEKGIRGIAKLLEIAVDNDYISRNPCAKLYLEIKEGDVTERIDFAPADLANIFNSPVFQNPAQRPLGGGGDAAKWIPLIALFTGARLEEIGQLLVCDIKMSSSGIPYFSFKTIVDDHETLVTTRAPVDPGYHVKVRYQDTDDVQAVRLTDSVHAKSIKTGAGQRIVPIHSELIRSGFLQYVHEQATVSERLFPKLQYYRNRCTKNWSKWWARYQNEHVTNDAAKTFHSFRHTFISRFSACSGNDTIRDALVGHAKSEQARLAQRRRDPRKGYQHFDVATLNDEIQKLKYLGLDLSHLHVNNI